MYSAVRLLPSPSKLYLLADSDTFTVHALAMPLDEAAVIKILATLDELRACLLALMALFERLVEVQTEDTELPLSRRPWSRDQKLQMMGFASVASYASLVPAMHNELLRRQLNTDPNASRERLGMYIAQLEAHGHLAAKLIINSGDLRAYTSSPSMLPLWGAFVCQQVKDGRGGDLKPLIPR